MAKPSSTDEALPLYRFAHEDSNHTLTFDLPALDTLQGVELDIRNDQVRLRLPYEIAATVVSLPAEVTDWPCPASARFSKRRRQLIVTWRGEGAATVTSISPELGPAKISAKAFVHEEPAKREPDMAKPDMPVQSMVPRREEAPLEVAATTKQGMTQSPLHSRSEAEAKPAYGSIWNAGSWHWEEKNSLALARAEVCRALELCGSGLRHIPVLQGAGVVFKEVEVRGEASIALRKGRRIPFFDLSLSFRWQALDEFGGPLGAKGTCDVKGVTQEVDELPSVKVHVSALSSGGREAKAAGDWMRNQGSKAIVEALRGDVLSKAILTAEAEAADHSADQARRSEELAKAEAARVANTDMQARIAEEQRRLEGVGRVQPSVQGSAWNTNSWHWEERPMTEWSRAWLREQFSRLSAPLLGGLCDSVVRDVEVSGDASVSVRKGKPILLFQLALVGRWLVTPRTQGLEEAMGKVSVPEFTSEEGAQATEVLIEVSRDPSGGRIAAAFKKEGAKAFREVLANYTIALAAQLPQG